MEKLKEIIANMVVQSLERDFLEKKYILDLDSHNNLGMMKSDVINTNLTKAFSSNRFIIHKFKRYAWEGRFIVDLQTKIIVSITTISNLNHIPKVKGRKTPHYMQTALKVFNDTKTVKKQMSFDFYSDFHPEIYKEDMSNLFSSLDINLDEYTYYVVAYDFRRNKVTELNWCLLGSEFNVVEKSSMMNLVKPDFIDLTQGENFNCDASEVIEQKKSLKKRIKLGLKKNVLEKEG